MLGKVVKAFTDKLDQTIKHKVNDVYYTTDKARFNEVSSDKNAIREVLVKAMTVAELSEFAQKHNIEVPAKIKRDDLEALIEGELYGTDAE